MHANHPLHGTGLSIEKNNKEKKERAMDVMAIVHAMHAGGDTRAQEI